MYIYTLMTRQKLVIIFFCTSNRSGISKPDQLAILKRSLHTTSSQANQPGPNRSGNGNSSSGGDGNKNKNDDDERKGMLAKAALWMLTAYMFIAIISLLFPGSNQPEVMSRHS